MKEALSYMNNEIAKRVTASAKSPEVILAVAPCRSGTTAQLRVFAEAGLQSHYQPFKAILRDLEKDDEAHFTLPEKEKKIFIKETIGPYNYEQSTLDPVGILLEAGLSKDKLHVIPMMRQPLVTYASWKKVSADVEGGFGQIDEKNLLENAVLSYQTVSAIKERSEKEGIRTTTFVQEALRDNPSESVVKSLLRRTKLGLQQSSVTGWKKLPPMGSEASKIVFHPEGTAPYQDTTTKIIHNRLEESDGLKYFSKEDEELYRVISNEERHILEKSGVYALYDVFRKSSEADLGLTIKPTNELRLKLS